MTPNEILNGCAVAIATPALNDIYNLTKNYFCGQVKIFTKFTNKTSGLRLDDSNGVVEVRNLREKLKGPRLEKPMFMTVRGTLYPSALMASGWWERQQHTVSGRSGWDNELQRWLFNGFDLWAPSWNFTWDDTEGKVRPYCIAQIGSIDEANSLPIVMPSSTANRLMKRLDGNNCWSGFEAEVSGLLVHREHFIGGLSDLDQYSCGVDYCLKIDDENEKHGIKKLKAKTDTYSGYLWKCVVPKELYQTKKNRIEIKDSYFIWEHTNFANHDAVKYNLDGLASKERYIEKLHGDLVVLQKSSEIVPGGVEWTKESFNDVFMGREEWI